MTHSPGKLLLHRAEQASATIVHPCIIQHVQERASSQSQSAAMEFMSALQSSFDDHKPSLFGKLS